MKIPIVSLELDGGSREKPRPETWAASPIDLYGRESVKKQQLRVGNLLMKRAEDACKKLGLGPELTDAIVVSSIQRFHYESTINHCNYSDRLFETPGEDMELEFPGSYERAMKGTATPHDLLPVRSVLGMPSIELAKLSHIGGIGIDDLDVMRRSVHEAVTAQGGVMYDDEDVETTLSPLTSDGLMFFESRTASAIVMNRKRVLGEMPDGTSIREKSQFILRIDEQSGFDQSIASEIRNYVIEDGRSWLNHIKSIPGFEEAVLDFLKQDDFKSAIPLVTTTYACNKETEKLAKEKKEKAKLKGSSAMGSVATSSIVFIRETDGRVYLDSDSEQE